MREQLIKALLAPVSYTHLRAHETKANLVCRLLLEKYPYRYVETGIIELNGQPDYRIQKYNTYTMRYRDMYLCDNFMQLETAMEDFQYTKWLDPSPEVTAYAKNERTTD